MIVLVTSTAAAEPTSVPTPGQPYRIHKGDTCVSIATRAYGARSKVPLLHEGNPGLGPEPHYLKAGSVMMIPLEKPDVSSPDARLRAVRNQVKVEAAEAKPGKVNDPLFRGNRVATEQRSGADVLFRDESELRMGERTLVIILGDSKSRTRAEVRETTLVSGELTTKLAALSATRVATDGAVADVRGEARVSVDAKKTTRVAALKGDSSVTAQKKKVEVKEGFGSKVELGKAPTPPRPLPIAPGWREGGLPSMTLTQEGATADVAAVLQQSGEGKISGYRVQVAQDAEFRDLESDLFVAAPVDRVEVAGLVAGVYYVRVASVDDDDFVGKFSEPISTRVVALRATPEGYTSTDGNVQCATTSQPGKQVTKCTSDDGRQATLEREVPMPPEPHVEVPPEKRAEVPVEKEKEAGFEATVSAGVAFGWNTLQLGPIGDVGFAYGFPLGPGALVLGAAVGAEIYPEDRRDVYVNDQRLFKQPTSHTNLNVGIPITYRFGGRKAMLRPIVQLRPEMVYQAVDIGGTLHQDGVLFGLRGSVGTQLTFGQWALDLQGGYRMSTVNATSAPFRGGVFTAGLRRFF